jgi:hypothetical protein
VKNKVKYVKEIRIAKDLTEQDKLAIKARGVAELKMKISPVLIPKDYDKAPADGIYELDFSLDESNESFTDVDLDVEVVFYFRNLPAWVKGIKINAAENSDIELL